MAAPEPLHMQKPSFTLTMPHSVQPCFSLSSSQPQPSVPGPSSSAPGPSQPALAQLAPSQPSGSCVPKLADKNWLQEFAQRSNLPLPVYQLLTKGLHMPRNLGQLCGLRGSAILLKMFFLHKKRLKKMLLSLHMNV